MLKFISLKEAWDILSSMNIPKISTKRVNVLNSIGCIIAEEVHSNIDIPFDNIALFDGYAVKAEDVASASHSNPIILKLFNEASSISYGQAKRVSTGEALPKGANAVVPKEFVKEYEKFIEITTSVPPYAYVARRGEDVQKESVLLRKGEIVDPLKAILLLRSLVEEVLVFNKLNVGLLVIGSELTRDIKMVKNGRVLDITSLVVKTFLQGYANVKDYGLLPDEPQIIKKYLIQALMENDLVVTIGGTSVGSKDLTPKVVRQLGEIIFHGVSIMPGRPVGVGKVEEKLIFMLSGFPVAAYNEFKLLLEPFILLKVYGAEIKSIPYKARATRRIPSRLGILEMVRVTLNEIKGCLYATPLRIRGSGILSSLAYADGIVIVPEELEGYDENQLLDVYRVEDPWGAIYVEKNLSQVS